MPDKKMRPAIKLEDNERELLSDKGQEEEACAGRGRRRRPNEGAAAAAKETRSLLKAHAGAQVQAQAFG
jgi:hypothetical protein